MVAPQNMLTTALAVTFFAITYQTSIFSVVASAYSTRDDDGYYLTAYLWGFIFSPVGLFVGALAAWPLSARLGRRPVIMAAIAVSVFGGILSLSAGPYGLLIAGFLVGSLASGVIWVIAIVWQVEVAEAGHRGRRVVTLYIAAFAGSAFAAWMNLAFTFTGSYDTRTRAPIGLQLIFLVPAAILIYFSSESWRYLLQHSQPDRARAILERTNPNLAASFDTLLLHARHTSPTLLTCCASRSKSFTSNLRPYRRLLLATLLQILQNYAGIGTASTYMYASVYRLFNGPGYVSTSTSTFEAALPTIQLAFTFLPLFFIDRPIRFLSGRRNLLIVSSLGMAVCFLPPIIAGATAQHSDSFSVYRSNSKVDFAFFLIANLFYTLGLGPITNLYAAEIAPSNCRVAVMAVAFALGTAFNVMYQWLFKYMVGLEFYLFIVWMFLDIGIALVVWFIYPETAGKGLEMIDLVFARGLGVWVFKDREARGMRRGYHNEGDDLRDVSGFGGAQELGERRRSVDRDGDVDVEREEHVVGEGQRKT